MKSVKIIYTFMMASWGIAIISYCTGLFLIRQPTYRRSGSSQSFLDEKDTKWFPKQTEKIVFFLIDGAGFKLVKYDDKSDMKETGMDPKLLDLTLDHGEKDWDVN